MFAAIVMAAGFMIFGLVAVGKGLVLGALFSILNFVIQSFAVAGTLDSTRRRSSYRSFLSLALRLFVLAIPLYLGIRFDAYNLAAVVVGIFAVQLAILIDHTLVARIFGNKDGMNG